MKVQRLDAWSSEHCVSPDNNHVNLISCVQYFMLFAHRHICPVHIGVGFVFVIRYSVVAFLSTYTSSGSGGISKMCALCSPVLLFPFRNRHNSSLQKYSFCIVSAEWRPPRIAKQMFLNDHDQAHWHPALFLAPRPCSDLNRIVGSRGTAKNGWFMPKRKVLHNISDWPSARDKYIT